MRKTDSHFYDNRVEPLLAKAEKDIALSNVDYLGNSKRQIRELRSAMYHYRDDDRIAGQFKQLGIVADQVNARLDELNRTKVCILIETASNLVTRAEQSLVSPSLQEGLQWIKDRIIDRTNQAEVLLNTVKNDLHLKPFSLDHCDSISLTRSRIVYLRSSEDDFEALIIKRLATQRREEAEQRAIAEELEAQQTVERERELAKRAARARQELEARQREIESMADQVKALKDRFWEVARSDNPSPAKDIYREISALDEDVRAHYFVADQQMQRMVARLDFIGKTLKGVSGRVHAC